jgi:hypothetical protein
MKPAQAVRGTLALLAFGVAGCSTVTVDEAPDGAAKGYVEFQPAGDRVGRVLVEELTYGGRQRIDPTALFGLPDYNLRIAAPPGWHTYNISVAPVHEQTAGPSQAVTVFVRKDHVTPVTVRRTIIARDYSDEGTHIQFTISINLGAPMPLR